jgi:hypothetical protein
MRNCLFRFIAKFRETTSLFRETQNLFRFVFREIRNETSFAGNPSPYIHAGFAITQLAFLFLNTSCRKFMLLPFAMTIEKQIY